MFVVELWRTCALTSWSVTVSLLCICMCVYLHVGNSYIVMPSSLCVDCFQAKDDFVCHYICSHNHMRANNIKSYPLYLIDHNQIYDFRIKCIYKILLYYTVLLAVTHDCP